MDISNKLIDTINDLRVLKSQPDLPEQIIKISLKNIPYPDNLKKTLYTNPEWGLKILNRYNEITKFYIEDDNTLDNLLQFLNNRLIKKNTDTLNDKKAEYSQMDILIFNYLEEQNFFQKCFDELSITNVEVTKQDVINYKTNNSLKNKPPDDFVWRINQLVVFEHVKKHGIVTGINCQATGCGKTFIILKYIDFHYKTNKKCKIILFTERVNILADLFDFTNTSNPIDSDNVIFWKEKGICDLTQFNIIDRVTVKKSDWVEQLNKSDKPTLLVINRAYLTLTDGYKNIKGLSLILHDECHNVASNKCYNFLKYVKSIGSTNQLTNNPNTDKTIKRSSSKSVSIIKSIPIVGFSATPLRAGKTRSGDESVLNSTRLCEIYGLADGQLNLITNYNMIYSICEKLILPPRFYWFDIENYQTKSKNNCSDTNTKTKKQGQISKPELGSVMKILDDLIPLMPNRKIIAWCGTIPLCDEWYGLFDEYKPMYPNLKNIKLYKDYSKKINSKEILQYDDFKLVESDGIMFCAQKHREGSDIFKLDGCIFLDKVKTRGAIPFIQSIGRVLRLESSKDSKKTCGFVIDGVVRDDEDYEKNIVDKILGYYFALSDLANINEINGPEDSAYSKYVKLMDLINFDPDEKIIKLRLDKTIIEINCKKLDWGNIIKNFDSILEKKVNLNPDDKLRAEFEGLKKIALELGKKNNYKNLVESWKKLAQKNNLPIEPNKIYCKFWKGWYDFYQIDINKFPKTKRDWLKKCKKINVSYKNYMNIVNKFDYLPEIPGEIYQDFKNLKIELEFSNLKLDNNMI